MDGFHSVAQEDTDVSKEHEPENQATKRRKMAQKTVITCKIKADERKHKNQRPPSDCWSWRKYGQKPIKGSPYPRGYYRCSTSKGCLAKKQVERSRTDASMLVITYTSSHNHPGPDLPTNLTQESKEPQTPVYDDHTKSPNQEPEQKHDQDSLMNSHEDPSFNNSKEIVITQEENPLAESLENTYDSPNVINQESPLCSHHLMTFSTSKTEGINDFYDELEELPTYSSLSSLTISNFFEERTLVDLS